MTARRGSRQPATCVTSIAGPKSGWMTGGRLVVRCKVDDAMRNGQLVLPHGYGLVCPTSDGERLVNGPRINLLTKSGNRDPIAGTPYHKNVAVRVALVSADEAAAHQS